MSNFAVFLVPALVLTVIVVAAWLCRGVDRLARDLRMLRDAGTAMQAQITAMLAQYEQLQQQLGEVERSCHATEIQTGRLGQRDLDERRYAEAVRLVRRGAGKENVAARCGLSDVEADLVARLHGLHS